MNIRLPHCSVLSLILFLSFGSSFLTAPAPASELRLTYLANEGFLIEEQDGESRGRAVLIDAFVPEPYSIYAQLEPKAWAEMLAGEGRFNRIDLALVSHRHGDHLQPGAAALFLEAHPETLLVTSPQVLAMIEKAGPLSAAAKGRTREILPVEGKSETLSMDGLQVEVLNLRHGGERHREVQNLGHILHLAGKTLLHVGDVETSHEVFAPYRLAERQIDISLVPYWFFLSPEGREIVNRHLRGKITVAVHIPPRELAEVQAHLRQEEPEVVVFERRMQRRSF